MSFKGKVVIVTGASSGIGAATALEMTRQGAHVVMVGRNQTKLDNVAKHCADNGNKPFVVNAELTKDEDVKRIMDSTINKFGKLDVLVNNAGAATSQPFGMDTNITHFDGAIALNLRAAVYLTNLAVPYLTKTKGCVVNVSSVAAKQNINSLWAYCAAKAGLDHFSRCIAYELSPKGIRVNVVSPGPVRTDAVLNRGMSNELMDNFAKSTPLQRISDAEELADVIVFLASERARGVTGADWTVDNGMLVKFTGL